VLAFAIRRSCRHNDPALAEPSAAVTLGRVGVLPSPPPLPDTPDVSGLERVRGGEFRTWTVEACRWAKKSVWERLLGLL
jgi:hypothetical protein